MDERDSPVEPGGEAPAPKRVKLGKEKGTSEENLFDSDDDDYVEPNEEEAAADDDDNDDEEEADEEDLEDDELFDETASSDEDDQSEATSSATGEAKKSGEDATEGGDNQEEKTTWFGGCAFEFTDQEWVRMFSDGMLIREHEKRPDMDASSLQKVRRGVEKINEQLAETQYGDEGYAWYMPPREVKAGVSVFQDKLRNKRGDDAEQPNAAEIIVRGLLKIENDGDNNKLLEVLFRQITTNQKNAFVSSYRSIPMYNKKKATKLLHGHAVEESLYEAKFYCQAREVHFPVVLLVGQSKQLEGGLFGIIYFPPDEDYFYHGR